MKLIGKHPNMSVNNINNEKLKDQNDVNEGNGDKDMRELWLQSCASKFIPQLLYEYMWLQMVMSIYNQ